MADEQSAINIADIPALRLIAQEVSRTRQRRKVAVNGEDVTIIVEPNRPRRSDIPRGKQTSHNDPLWKIIGIGKDERTTDVSENHDRYLADWELSNMR
jgi:hypothetical protein